MKILNNKWTVLIASLLLAAVSITTATRLRINSDIETYLPANMSSKINTDSIESLFGKDEPLMLIFDCPDLLDPACLQRIWQINEALAGLPQFTQQHSLFNAKVITSDEGMMVVEPLVQKLPVSVNETEALRQRIRAQKMVFGHLVSEDYKTTFILLNANHEFTDKQVLDTLFKTIRQHPGKGDFYLYGPLYMRAEANQKITRDFILLLPLGLLIMILFLYFSFRQKRAAILPMVVVLISILVCFGVMPLFHWELSIIGILIPVMMIAIANDYGIHFITKYQELSVTRDSLSEAEIVSQTRQYLKMPILLTGITTLIGLMGMILHIILPAKQVGIISSIGITTALILSLTLIPASLVLLRRKSNGKGFFVRQNTIRRLLESMAALVQNKPRRILGFFALFIVLAVAGFSRFEIARDFDNILHRQHPYSKAGKLANERLGGTKNIRVLFQGDMKDPSMLRRMDHYGRQLEALPEVGTVNSLSTMIREMTKAMNGPEEPGYDVIPDQRNAVAQYLELYAMSGDPEDLEDFADFNFEHGLMEVQFIPTGKNSIQKIQSFISELVRDDPAFSLMGGYCLIENQMNRAIARGQLYSLVFAWVAITLLLGLLFKSRTAGWLGGLPLLLAILCTMGIMGWTGIQLNIVTALLSSISIGLGVDYTIHIFWRIKKELNAGHDFPEAIRISLITTGYGVTINAFSVMIGFSVLLFSSFGLIQSFAFLVILSIGFCLTCSLLLIPAAIVLLKPKFLTK